MFRVLVWILALGLQAEVFSSFAYASSSKPEQKPAVVLEDTIYQMRVYELVGKNKAAFYERFYKYAVPIMRRYGFDIVEMWEVQSKQKTEFIYVLRWSSEMTMRQQWRRFRADPEWLAVVRDSKRKYGEVVSHIEERQMRSIVYSRWDGSNRLITR